MSGPNQKSGALSEDLNRVAMAYVDAANAEMANQDLFSKLVSKSVMTEEQLSRRDPVGKAGIKYNLAKRTVRWQQQTLKAMGVLERHPDRRGVWRLTAEGKRRFVRPSPGRVLLAFSTDLGLALWGQCEDVFQRMDQPITLALASPPYALAQPRAYGNVPAREYVEWLIKAVDPVVKALRPGGSIVLNVSQDTFEPGSPARSTILERFVIAMEDRLGMCLMDRFVWHNTSKPPGPIQWASLKRVHVNVAWEPCFVFCNDPSRYLADNRRVLLPHTERHLALIRGGGEQRNATYCDGAYKIRKGKSFTGETAGRIAKNVLAISHNCPGQRAYKRAAKALGLPAHGAPMPEALAEFFVLLLSQEGDLLADFMAGSFTFAAMAEKHRRAWIASEVLGEYCRGGATRFENAPGFVLGQDLIEGLSSRHGLEQTDGQLSLQLHL